CVVMSSAGDRQRVSRTSRAPGAAPSQPCTDVKAEASVSEICVKKEETLELHICSRGDNLDTTPKDICIKVEDPECKDQLYCEVCKSFFFNKCEAHGPPVFIPDNPVPMGVPDRARQTLPSELEIQQSSIPDAGPGVFNKGETVPVGAHFGPYQGELVTREEAMASEYSWVICRSRQCEQYIDAKREMHANWMRYVNCARNDDEQNLVAFQYRGEILYRSCRPINPGQELLVWYEEEYAEDLSPVFDSLWNKKCSRTGESDVLQWDENFSEISVSADAMEQARSSAPESQDVLLQEFHPSQHHEFDARYAVVELLAKEQYGTLYTGVHKADGKEVGIKCVMKDPTDELITIPEQIKILPLEVALIKLVSKPPLCENVVELLDWFETSTFFFLVVERPNPCMDLRDFCKLDNGRLAELVAQKVIQQVVRAARHCCERGVLHCDFEQNLLINPDTLEVKLVDFGCAEVMTDELYTDFPGNPAFSPPEWVQYRKYFGFPAIIWGLGVLLFEMVCGELPFCNEEQIVKGHLPFIPGLSD
ncbi:histone-lysine N-methyltransferase PRDM9-like, partial [Clarias magur]